MHLRCSAGVTGKDWQTAWCQNERHGVQEDIGSMLGAWAELQSRDEFGGGIKGDPHPEVVGLVAQGGE